jgi:hypothetical protein
MVRPFQEGDVRLIKAWHEASGFDYPLPNLSSPLFALLGVAESGGEMVAAAGIKLMGEAFYWQNPDSQQHAKAKAMLQLHKALHTNAVRQLGLDQVYAWLPPEIEKDFAPLLVDKFGWRKSDWQGYGKTL